MKPLTIEIHGTGTHNRGAELMAIAVAERMRATFPEARLVVSPHFGDAFSRARHRFLTTWEFYWGIRAKITGVALKYGSPGVRDALALVPPQEIDVVLDASGFAFSDQWGPHEALRLLKKMNGPARKGKPLILLPQAIGAFSKPEVAKASRDLFRRAALVCARDSRSYTMAKNLGISSDILRQFPDFTVGVEPLLPQGLHLPADFSAIVPNFRMMDKGSSATGYIDFLTRSIRLLQARGMNPVFVLHDAEEDRKVVDQCYAAGEEIPAIKHDDPRVLKSILGRAALVLGSRFHALVSGLSQGVPCIGAGWSHKYLELFSDFSCPELLIADLTDTAALEAAVDRLVNASSRIDYERKIKASGIRIKESNQVMWHEVESLIRTLTNK
jgi:polysaccharide pyruvyl transferase WcaK-like protein